MSSQSLVFLWSALHISIRTFCLTFPEYHNLEDGAVLVLEVLQFCDLGILRIFLRVDPAIRSERLVKIAMTEPCPFPPPSSDNVLILNTPLLFSAFSICKFISASLLWATRNSPLIQLKMVDKRCKIWWETFVSYI